ncbi:MAG: AbrB/MazE/SpoVT family DNA-binding domain-containing protein [Fimbriimonadaceae bacterium]
MPKYEKYELYNESNEMGVDFDQCFYGSVTVGERGQIVIPAEARAALGIQPGDKLLVMRDPVHPGLMVCSFGVMNEFLEEIKAKLAKAEQEFVPIDAGEEEK